MHEDRSGTQPELRAESGTEPWLKARRVPSSPWPELPYDAFAPTARLVHRGLQAVGKLTLLRPFEPQSAHTALLPTSRGLTTGPIPWRAGVFSVEIDFVAHALEASASDGRRAGFGLGPMSVADWLSSLYAVLDAVGVEHRIDPRPYEVPDPVPFHEDSERRPYDKGLTTAWWRILVGSFRVLQVHHSRFTGNTPPVGFMWGSSDLRDARYGGVACAVVGDDKGHIRDNAWTEWQAQAGWWHGNEVYPRPAYFAFVSPAPRGIERATVRPAAARWEPTLGEFILDYDDVRGSDDPEADLLAFLESTFEVGMNLAGRTDVVCPRIPENVAGGAPS